MSELARILCVVPARGGSKGLPRKNVLPLAGLPLIGHSLACARRCPEITRTIVTTDDAEIAEVARRLGGDVPFLRPPELARDDTPMIPVLQHALRTVEETEGRPYDALLLFDPTSPGRLPSDVTAAIAALRTDGEAVGAVACSQPHFNPFWVGVVEKDGALARAYDVGKVWARRQDVPRFLRINGSLYLWRRDFLLGTAADWLDRGRHALVEIPESRAFSVDDASELALLEAVLAARIVKLPWLEEGTT